MRRSVPVVVLSLLVAVAGPLSAQGLLSVPSTDTLRVTAAAVLPDTASAPVVTPAPSREVLGAPMTGLRAGVHARETARPARPLPAAGTMQQNQARAMMIVGVAGLIAGAIIGDTPGTIIMVGGTVVGLIGLYEYLQ
jgi:hypothetical protein